MLSLREKYSHSRPATLTHALRAHAPRSPSLPLAGLALSEHSSVRRARAHLPAYPPVCFEQRAPGPSAQQTSMLVGTHIVMEPS